MIENLEGEIWAVHPKYNWIAASNFGRIKSIERDVYKEDGTFLMHLQEHLFDLKPNKNGYLRFNIKNTNLGINDYLFVHRFVWECFHQIIIPKGSKELQINHKNEDKTDNRVFENLELVTPKQNSNWGTRNKRVAESKSKAVGQYDLEGNLIKVWKSTMEAERNGFKHGCISRCCNGKIKNHQGFIWKYIKQKKEN